MKIFVYKVLFVFFFIFVLFHLTFGYTIRSFESKFYNTFSKDKITFIKDKIREEMKNSIKKDKILYEDDALLINKFINKIVSEIK
ncbi:hypothetical protein OAA54_01210 [Pelagibacteraceae bacterium]|jgi:hypothetical protein|nr:hypothetical protein [Pelagibacteraceae bacterium]|tara:strand:+ start:2084 stop:2338 length:255 start_codon:yes stop_codon:yes gene_type:complete